MRKKMLVLGFVTAQALALSGPSFASAQAWRTVSSARQVWETDPIEVEINYGVGQLTVGAAAPSMLYQMLLRYDEDEYEPLTEYDAEARRLRLGVESLDEGNSIDARSSRRARASARIGLARDVPIRLDLGFGAGRADIDLGGMTLQSVEIATGASETRVSFSAPNRIQAESVVIEAGAADLEVTGLANSRAKVVSFEGGVGATVLDFGGEWTEDVSATVEMGVGRLTLRLPRDQGVRLNRSSFLTAFSADGMVRQGDSYISRNWESAAHKLTIEVSTALGSVDVQWID